MAADSISSKSRGDDAITSAGFHSVDVAPVAELVHKTSPQLFVHFFLAPDAEVDHSMAVTVVLKITKSIKKLLGTRWNTSLLCPSFKVLCIHFIAPKGRPIPVLPTDPNLQFPPNR